MSGNFTFLEKRWPVLTQVGTSAERYVYEDPNTAISKLRLYAETMTKYILAFEEIREAPKTTQVDRLRVLLQDQIVPKEVYDLFQLIRLTGNKASHQALYGTVDEALTLLETSHQLSNWFMEVYGDWDFQAAEFKMPEKNLPASDVVDELTEAYEQKLAEMEEELKKIRSEQLYIKDQDKKKRQQEAKRIASKFEKTEKQTRKQIDQQLMLAGWLADTELIRYSNGSRPEKGKNKAIAEWPMKGRVADYALFIGMKLVGIVEAKRESKDVYAAVVQAKDYASLVVQHEEEEIFEPWGDYFVPFLFATNGREYMKQFEQKSGIWFLDVRRTTNHPRALKGWYSPEGLEKLLDQDQAQAEKALQDEKFDYLKLRPYQVEAIQSVEKALSADQKQVLLAMATGTGKTRMAIGLIYRLLKAKRFKRILFLVDRSALGEQAENAFKDSKLESFHTFTEIYELQGLTDKKPNKETKVQIATVQGMLKRLFSQDTSSPLTVDQYDCIIVDEAHRGYTLDREMSEAETLFRDHKDYVSKYRQVLDFFDAVKIGLTATPALHTTEIFGPPVYTYSYREAVVEGYLIDHEPPYTIKTELNTEGIKWDKGATVNVYDTKTRELTQEKLEDEVNVEVTHFNTRVVTENFNRVVVEALVNYISPYDDGKTLIFAATDDHADLVVRLLKEAFDEQYDGVEDHAVMKVTGSIDSPSETIRRFKNEKFPSIVVTVDLLTTGIDVPAITNLVFLRRVRSRILYEQMLGRATRRCEEIGKDHFNIYDAVGLYEALKPYTTMKPIVARPNVKLTQLAEEFDDLSEQEHLDSHLDEIVAKLQRKKQRMSEKGAEDFKTLTDGKTVDELAEELKTGTVEETKEKLKTMRTAFQFLDENRHVEHKLFISDHEDNLTEVTRGYGKGEKPGDYLQSFDQFIKDNMNEIPALMLICQRPAELTREELKKLKLALDQEGFTEKGLQSAWRDVKNEDIAADIIAFIRQHALGDPLISHEERIRQAMKRVYQKKVWPPVQKKWLERIEKQLMKESVLHPDPEEAFSTEPFKSKGGFRQLDKIFKGELPEIVREINEGLYDYQHSS